MAVADMRLPIAQALWYPERSPRYIERLDLTTLGRLEFEAPDTERFPCLALAVAALQAGGTMPCVLNAANEVAVTAFLQGRLGFMQIPRLIEEVMERHRPAEVTLKTSLPAMPGRTSGSPPGCLDPLDRESTLSVR